MSASRSWFAKTKKALSSPRAIRTMVQMAVFAAVIFIPVGLFHMLCPFGGITTLTRFLQQGLYIPKTGLINLVFLGALLLTTIIAGPVFCGWLCPLGSIQDWIRMLAKKLRIPEIKVPAKLDKILSLLRYVVLFLILRATAISFNLAFINADPYYALMHFWTGEVALTALIVLGLVLVSSIFVSRPWCRWFCPLGAILSLIGRFSIFRIKKPSFKCVSCGKCSAACPVGIDPSADEKVTELRCIRCGECAPACPPKIRTAKHSYTVSLIAALALLAFFVVVPRFMEDTKEEFHKSAAAEAQATFQLRAMSRLSELPQGLGIEKAAVYELLELPADYDESTRLIDIEEDFEEKTFAWIQAKLEEMAP